MFLRKLCVVVLPLLMAGLVCLLFSVMEGNPFWTEVLQGITLGVCLALLLPLCGATKKREPFAGLLWAPLMTLIIVVLSQYLAVIGIEMPVLSMLRTGDSNVILVESAFIGFLLVEMLRTRR